MFKFCINFFWLTSKYACLDILYLGIKVYALNWFLTLWIVMTFRKPGFLTIAGNTFQNLRSRPLPSFLPLFPCNRPESLKWCAGSVQAMLMAHIEDYFEQLGRLYRNQVYSWTVGCFEIITNLDDVVSSSFNLIQSSTYIKQNTDQQPFSPMFEIKRKLKFNKRHAVRLS